jgi:hypothetical protein
MNEPLHNPEAGEDQSKPSRRTVALSVLVAVAVVASFWLVFEPFHKNKGRTRQGTDAPMGAPEREYLKKIQIGDLALSRAENFLHQEVTILNGDVLNSGNQFVSDLRVTTEFADDMNQIVLRETREVLASTDAALAPGEKRGFEISFERIPASWNTQQPAVHVAYVQFTSRK